MKYFLLLLFLLIFNFSCTDNPFFDDDAAEDRKILTGKVLLNSGETPQDIYVWLEELNISTRTNSQGDFRIELPRTEELNGYNNDLKLYYYVGNYKIQYSNVLIVDGEFEYGKYDLDNDGKIIDPVVLIKLIDITTSILPQTTSVDDNESLEVTVDIINLDTNLLVQNQTDRDGNLSGIIIRNINLPRSTAERYEYDRPYYRASYLNEPTTFEGLLGWGEDFPAPGTYKVSAYVFLKQDEIPQELLDSFGQEADKFTDAYLKIPFTQTTATLTIQ
jgi:hypothetical protein